MRIIGLLYLLLSLNICPVYANDYHILVLKQKKQLLLKSGEQLVKTYDIAIGHNDKGHKQIQGDKKTPVGKYTVAHFKENSRFHFFMQINYPNPNDAWYGYKNQLISSSEFKEIILAHRNDLVPPQDTKLGGYIGIHGLGSKGKDERTHPKMNWTQGCIALTNQEIDELRKYVSIGTPITIKE